MAKVVLKNVCKDFDDFRAVDNISFEVNDGEFLTMVGPSGCGKTTTMRMIAGLETVTEGEIWIGDRIVNNVPPKDRDIAMVFQDYAIYPHMTVFENIAYGLRARKTPKKIIDQKVKEAAGMMGLTDLLNRKPGQLSGGERQRVALCRAIVRDPKVFLFDEPLSNLDAKMRTQARNDIVKLQRKLGVTAIYVTHDQVEALTMGDRVAVLSKGHLEQVGTPDDLYDRPANMHVAGFIGSPAMNFFNGRVEDRDGEIWIKGLEWNIKPLPKMAEALKPWVGKEVVFGIRPEDMRFGESDIEANGENEIYGILDMIEPLGTERALHLRIESDSGEEETFVVVTPARVRPTQIGKKVQIVCDLVRSHIFDPETEKAICNGGE